MRFTGSSLVGPRVLALLLLSMATACGGDEDIDGKDTSDPSTTNQNDAGDSDNTADDDTTDDSAASDTAADGTAADGTAADDTDTAADSDQTSSDPDNSNTSDTPTDTTTEPPVTEIPLVSTVGVACDDDDDCEDGLTCLTHTDELGGTLPGTGLCTAPCTDHDECAEHDEFSLCVGLGVAEPFASYCMQACLFGAEYSDKCSGLAESSCFPLDNQTQPDGTVLGACFPQCHNDDDCASDTFCDTWSGLCVEDALPGKAPGEVCDLEAENDECGSGGGCVSIAEGIPTGFCTVSCNIHTDTLVCGDDEAGPDAKAVCFPHVQIADYFGTLSSVNDVGQCLPLCDRDADCPPGTACDIGDDDALVDIAGRAGVCWPTEDAVQSAIEGNGDTTTPDAAAPPAQDAGDGDGELSNDTAIDGG